MTKERMVELLRIERECMRRGARGDCDRNCAGCELVQDDGELDEMYTDVIKIIESSKPRQPGMRPLETCPADVLVVLTDEFGNMYLGTVTERDGQLYRGECAYGDAELFYRNRIVGWEPYHPS